MVKLTSKAVEKVKSVLASLDTDLAANERRTPSALRVGVRGGGCSGFQYALEFANDDEIKDSDIVLDIEGLKVVVDQMSAMYLEGVEIDYSETLTESGFKFNNPNVKRTCGCGSSFSA